MKKQLCFTLLFLASFSFSFAQISTPPGGGNQKSAVTQYIGSLASVTITYNSPDVTSPRGDDRRGKIWGQLVPYGLNQFNFGLNKPAPWRAGANENTVIEFSHDVLVQGKPIAAGKYGFHIIVEETGPWTLIFSKNSGAWGSYFYDEADDALRVEATPEKNEFHEWLTYEFIDRQNEFTVAALMWEEIKLPFKIEVANYNDLYIAQINSELQNSPGFSWQNWVTAANFTLQNNTHLEKGLEWADAAISTPFIGQANFTTLSTKAAIQSKMGKTADADVTMKKAIEHPTANPIQIHGYGRQLIAQGKKDKAMEIFKYNHQQFKGAWPTEVGMARGLSALGKYDQALKHAKIALTQAPDKLNKDGLTASIEKLKNKEDIN
jgi:tetratricopeptide (TPR) repeat protein